jgi:3-oxoacyl-[acyl-carrier protein] reductase
VRDLSEKVVVITGASGGIGRALVGTFAARGAYCVAHAFRQASQARQSIEEARAQGAEGTVVVGDVARSQARRELAEACWEWRGGVDVWINNAGADVLTGPGASESFDEKLERLWRVDVAATLDLSRDVGRRMKERGRGVIINIGWDQAWQGMAGDSGELFAAVKGAVMSFSLSLAQSLAPEVRVNCLAPGWIRTSWGERASEKWQTRARSESLQGRWGTPEDVAHAAAFLASPAADFISGQIINVNGGFRYGT